MKLPLFNRLYHVPPPLHVDATLTRSNKSALWFLKAKSEEKRESPRDRSCSIRSSTKRLGEVGCDFLEISSIPPNFHLQLQLHCCAVVLCDCSRCHVFGNNRQLWWFHNLFSKSTRSLFPLYHFRSPPYPITTTTTTTITTVTFA